MTKLELMDRLFQTDDDTDQWFCVAIGPADIANILGDEKCEELKAEGRLDDVLRMCSDIMVERYEEDKFRDELYNALEEIGVI